MAPLEPRDQPKKTPSPFNLDPSEFAAVGQRRMEELGAVQTELLQKFQEANRQWTERLLAEAKLSADFGSRLMAAGSMPEALNILQEWTSRRFEMIAEDGRRLLDDTRKFLAAGARLASSWQARGPGVGD